jgi:hypothetical protein
MIAAPSRRSLQPSAPISAPSQDSCAIPHLNNVFSSSCRLLRTFCVRGPLFSTNYRLFCQKHRGWGTDEVFNRDVPDRDTCLTRTPARLFYGIAETLPSTHWWTMRSQCARSHPKSRRQRRWDIPQKISATRAASFMRGSCCGIRAQPMTPRFAQLVDALNRESRQILHHSLRNCVALKLLRRVSITNSCLTELS